MVKKLNKKFLIEKFIRIFSFIGEEFEDIELEGFDLSTQSLFCGNVAHNQILQVFSSSLNLKLDVHLQDTYYFFKITSTSVRLIKSIGDTCMLVDEWKVTNSNISKYFNDLKLS